MDLYGIARSRTRRCLWALEEAAAPYTLHIIDPRRGDTRQESFLRINPNGKVPALVDGDLVLFESAAICRHIALRYPAAGLLPEPGTRDAALCDQWMFWVVAELEQPLWSMGKHRFALPEEYRLGEPMLRVARHEWQRPSEILGQALEGREFLVGDHFTVADILAAHTLMWARGFGVPLGSELLERYLERMTARPAYLATLRHG